MTRNRWRIVLYDAVPDYPFNGVFHPAQRVRMLRRKRKIPALFVLDMGQPRLNLTCPDCGGWQFYGERERLTLDAKRRPTIDGLVLCAIRRSQEHGNPYPETHCPGGRFTLTAGRLRRVSDRGEHFVAAFVHG